MDYKKKRKEKGTNVWKCADDLIESAWEWCQRSGTQEDIGIIEMDSVPHSWAFSFVVKDFLEKWADNTDSFLVDSTCEQFFFSNLHCTILNTLLVNTNKSNMELFDGMANFHGEGLPLSYLFVVTSANAPPQTKETVLVRWMSALKACGIAPKFTLSDKDQAEINALHQVWPMAKHQLCFWHVMRALKHQLANN